MLEKIEKFVASVCVILMAVLVFAMRRMGQA